MNTMKLAVVAMIAVGLLTGSAHALKVGDTAPALTSIEWLRGEPIAKFQPGHVYVLDFWATWCGPCIQSIPHLVSLSKKHAKDNVHVVGLAVFPRRGQRPTKEFIARRKDMDYQIGEDNRDGKAAREYLVSSGINSIPTAMVIDQKGKIAWIGHPMNGLDRVLEAVVAGNYDPVEQAKNDAKRQRNMMRAQQLNQKIAEAHKTDDTEAMIVLTQELVTIDPEMFAHAGVYKYLLLIQKGDTQGANSYAQTLISSTLAPFPRALDMLAMQIVIFDEIREQQRDLDVALQASIKSNELSEYQDATSLDTLARVHFARDDVNTAFELQTKAIELSIAGSVRDGMEQRLAQYQAQLNTADAESP